MPWPKNSKDLKWFKNNTIDKVVIMGRMTWEDPFIPTPLKNRINVLITTKNQINFLGVNDYIAGDLILGIKKLSKKYNDIEKFIIGGPNILNQLFNLVEEFYLTRIYGNFDCDNKFDLKKIENSMKLEKKIICDSSCHFEIWKK
jgi:dihydrofolate reductase